MATYEGTQTPGKYDNTGAPETKLETLQNYFRTWATSTETARGKFRRDFEYAEGNGKQWNALARQEVLKTGRPVLEHNQILPQVEFVCGLHRDMQIDFKLLPRGYEDIRLSEIATATLKAASDFTRLPRTSDRVFDDATICGLGVWEVLHTYHDAEDLLWGDIVVSRINPMSFIYDPWAVRMDLQDGSFMGKAEWMSIHDFKEAYPKFAHLAVPGEWLSRVNQLIGSSDDLGTGPNLIPELWDQSTGRIRVLTMWCKKPVDIVLMVDERTGSVQEFQSKDMAEQQLASMRDMAGHDAIAPYQIITQGMTAAIADQTTGMPVVNPMTGMPQEFGSPEMAQAHLNALSQKAGMEVYNQYKVITRQAKKPHWYKMVYWQTLEEGVSPYVDRNYPFVPYISRRFADDPESIMGIVRNLADPQDEYNKRYSNLLAHINSSSHSGWLNRKSGGANRTELELMGSKPGVVVEYANVAPSQITPVEMSQGHFAMLQTSERNILRISSINAEMVGQTTQQTVSGRAIKARQSGGATALKPRLRTYEESFLDLGRMVFSRIQQYFTPEKIRRIIGVSELSTPLGVAGNSIFTDPKTGMPGPEEMIFQYLQQVKDIEFDVAFSTQPLTDTERQAQFQTALQVASLVTGSGRVLGPATFNALIEMSDMPSKLASALKIDAMMPPVAPPDAGAQDKALQGGQQGMANGDGQAAGGDGSSTGAGGAKAEAAQQRSQQQV
jgi:hypothetical protein